MCNRSFKRRILTLLFPVFLLGFGAHALYLHDTRDELRRVVMLIQAQEIGTSLTTDSNFARPCEVRLSFVHVT